MRVVELFSGTGHISKAFRARGHETFRVDWSKELDAELHADISKLTAKDIIELCGDVPDVVWASPDCTTYSIATHRHRTFKEALLPKTEYAALCDRTNEHLWALIDELLSLGTKYYFVENPRGRYRHMYFSKGRPRYTTSYCAWGRIEKNGKYTMKPTDIFTNYINPGLLYCDGGHQHSTQSVDVPRDYLNRGIMPESFCDHIATISEN